MKTAVNDIVDRTNKVLAQFRKRLETLEEQDCPNVRKALGILLRTQDQLASLMAKSKGWKEP